MIKKLICMNTFTTSILLGVGYASIMCMFVFIILDLYDHKEIYQYIIFGCAGVSVGVLLLSRCIL